MDALFTVIPDGSITSTPGFAAGAVAAGIKKAAGALDLGMIVADKPGAAAAVFTRNHFQAAPVTVSREHIAAGKIQAAIVNAGCANAGTGVPGYDNALAMTGLAATKLGRDRNNVLVASTGVIGIQLPKDKISSGINRIRLTRDGGHDFAQAIMTTDTVAKEIAVTSARYGFTVGGCAKGSGMIHPDMATMLGFITTDASIGAENLQKALKRAVDRSFNVISVDGDTSTNDCVFLLSSRKSSQKIEPGTAAFRAFAQALEYVCIHLAKAIARDGEGATKLIELRVSGASTAADARKVVRTVLSSPLVKTAVHGADPNWGRIVAAAGHSGARFELDRVTLHLGEIEIFRGGLPRPFDKELVSAQLRRSDVNIRLDLGLGRLSVTGWGCDMSAEYVKINAEYTT